MQFRQLLIIAVAALAANAASAQTCVPADFTTTCNTDGSVQICDDFTDAAAPVEDSVTCTDIFGLPNDGVCTTDSGCVGTGCPPAGGVSCSAPVGGGCIGIGPQLTQDPQDDDSSFGVLCAADATCKTGAGADNTIEEKCVAHIGPSCSAAGVADTCVGNVAVFCLGNQAGTATLSSNAALDCAGLFDGGTCGKQPCDCDAQCGTAGKCNAGFCDSGEFCVFPKDPAKCATGEGEGEVEGEGEGEGGDDNPRRDNDAEDAPACSNAAGLTPTFAGLLLALVAVRRRRR